MPKITVDTLRHVQNTVPGGIEHGSPGKTVRAIKDYARRVLRNRLHPST